jgi:hypothetical protein
VANVVGGLATVQGSFYLKYHHFRAIVAASASPPEEQFAYLTEAIGVVSGQQSQSQFRLSLLENSNKVKTCENYEEKEGRINTDLLNRVIIVGGPLIPPSDDLQGLLVRQVFDSLINFDFSIFSSKR